MKRIALYSFITSTFHFLCEASNSPLRNATALLFMKRSTIYLRKSDPVITPKGESRLFFRLSRIFLIAGPAAAPSCRRFPAIRRSASSAISSCSSSRRSPTSMLADDFKEPRRATAKSAARPSKARWTSCSPQMINLPSGSYVVQGISARSMPITSARVASSST